MFHRSLLGRFLVALAAIGTVALSGPSHAQQATAKDTLEEVTITGSRVITNGNDSPTPLTVMTLDSMKATTPTTVFEQLREVPAFAAGPGSSTPNGYFPDTNTGTAALNLRAIGPQRALALFDGHRVPPSTPDGLVNINLMPQLLIQRVEVVTGGGSAVYGSDAISGVVNFIVDRKFNGLKVELQGGTSGKQDGRSYQAGIAAGTDLFGGRGHVEFSYQRINNDGVGLIATSRPGLFDWSLQGDGVSIPYHLVQGPRATFATFGGLVCNPCGPLPSTGAFNNYSFDQNGVLTPFVVGSTVGLNSGTQVGGDGVFSTSSWLSSSSRLDQVFARFDYNVTDKIHAYANAGGGIDYGYGGFQPGVDAHLAFGACNAFLTAAQQAAFGCTNQNDPNQPGFFLFKVADTVTNLLKTTESGTTVRNFDVLAGVDGNFGAGYHWDTSITVAQTSQKIDVYGVDEDPHLFAAMDAVVGPNGQIVCNITLTNPGLQPGCVPLNLFGPTSESQAALNYTFGTIQRTGTNKMFGWDGTLRGTPLSTGAGPVGMAISADIRRQTMDVTSSSVATGADCTGQRFGNCDPVGTNTWGNTVQPVPLVHQNAAEAAFEVNVPLLKDVPFIQSLSTDDAFRYTKYSNNGEGLSSNISARTWKLGLVWTVNDQLTLRATRSRDIRAPNLWDLFNPTSTQPFSIALDYLCDPQIGCGNMAPVTSGGNPYLKPEVGKTLTAGFVYRPTPNFSLSVDGYDIKVTDAIALLNGFDKATQQACYAGSADACSLQVRALGNYTTWSPANVVTLWYSRKVNLASIHTEGVDLESNYHSGIADHAFSMRALVTYTPHLIYNNLGFPTIDQAGAAYYDAYLLLPAPVVRAQLIMNYSLFQGLDLSASERWRSAMRFQGDRSLAEVGHVASVAYTNLNVAYSLPRTKTSLFLNIQNLFDQAPPHAGHDLNQGIPGNSGNGWAVGDDVIGRYFILGVRARF